MSAAPCLRPCAECGATPARLYLTGPACAAHSPAARAGRPEGGRTAGAPVIPPPARFYPDADAVPCVHCGQPCAPIAATLHAVVEHIACVPPPHRIRAAWAAHAAAKRPQEPAA